MKKPSRSMIDGTAVALAVIALLLMVLLLVRRCGSKADTVDLNVDTDSTSVSTFVLRGCGMDSTSTRQGKVRKPKVRIPKVYPERSPLDEPVDK